MNLGGIDYVADVMNHVLTEETRNRSLMKWIKIIRTVKSIRDKMFMFENIIDMDPRSDYSVYQGLRFQGYCICIKDCIRGYEERILCKYVRRMAETVKGDLEITTNVRLKEVEEAQQRIVNLIRKLEDAGRSNNQ